MGTIKFNNHYCDIVYKSYRAVGFETSNGQNVKIDTAIKR